MVRTTDQKTIETARAIIEANLARPRRERVADMIARGIIDKNGQVIHKGNGKKLNGSAAAKKKKTVRGKKS